MVATRTGQTPDKGQIIQGGRDPGGRRQFAERFQSIESLTADTDKLIADNAPPPPPPLPFPTDGLFYEWDPTLQGNTFLEETISSFDRDADFIGDPQFQSDPPLVILDGVVDQLRTPSVPSGEGYGGGGQEFTLYGVFLGEVTSPATSNIFFRELGRTEIRYNRTSALVTIIVNGEQTKTINEVANDTLFSIGMGIDSDSYKGWKNGAEVFDQARGGSMGHFGGIIEFGGVAGAGLLVGQIGFWFWWNRLLTNTEISQVHAVLQQSYPGLS